MGTNTYIYAIARTSNHKAIFNTLCQTLGKFRVPHAWLPHTARFEWISNPSNEDSHCGTISLPIDPKNEYFLIKVFFTIRWSYYTFCPDYSEWDEALERWQLWEQRYLWEWIKALHHINVEDCYLASEHWTEPTEWVWYETQPVDVLRVYLAAYEETDSIWHEYRDELELWDECGWFDPTGKEVTTPDVPILYGDYWRERLLSVLMGRGEDLRRRALKFQSDLEEALF